jgi:ATP-binding protein involved in chromosome partitioning
MLTAERITPRLIAVASGKGGVGKSTLSTNLAIAMARAGRSVGLVDADIYGPSQPRLMGVEGVKPEAEGKMMIPVMGAGGVPFLSMGQLVNPGQAIAWRGPMAGNALSQLVDAKWGNVREIVVDMPPGTGDIQLSMIQKHKPIGAVIISTPQDLALIDAMRAISFFDTAKVPIIGLVENMAGYLCPHCGEMSDPFGSGGAEAAAKESQSGPSSAVAGHGKSTTMTERWQVLSHKLPMPDVVHLHVLTNRARGAQVVAAPADGVVIVAAASTARESMPATPPSGILGSSTT